MLQEEDNVELCLSGVAYENANRIMLWLSTVLQVGRLRVRFTMK
jgi:hypothetical protein